MMSCVDSDWQNEARRCGVVLREVFEWLGGRDLARAGAACRAWHRAAADPPLWRHLVQRELCPAPLPALRHLQPDSETISWRQEYVSAVAGWKLTSQHVAAGGAALQHAALAPAHDVLALAADDASLALWRRSGPAWRELWRTELRARGWASVARVQWAERATRLLLAGPRLLIDDWELMVLRLDDNCCGATIASRVRCSPGAAGCWADADGDTFLSLELQLLAPGLAWTTVRSNAATQETQSEYAGVTAPLLRVFNEDGAHITHALVAGAADGRRTLVAASARGLGAWPVLESRPPPLLAGAPGELAARVRRMRERRAAAPEDDAPEPDEASVRAVCAPPDRECRLPAPVAGLALDDSGRRLWAACGDGAVWCVSAASLEALLVLRAPLTPAPAQLHYLQPAVSDRFVASPAGAFSPRVWTWSRASGAAAAAGGARGEAAGPAVCALLPRGDVTHSARRTELLVLAGDTLYVWHSRAPPQSSTTCTSR